MHRNEIEWAIKSLNLGRPDVKGLLDGAIVSYNIATIRNVKDVLVKVLEEFYA